MMPRLARRLLLGLVPLGFAAVVMGQMSIEPPASPPAAPAVQTPIAPAAATTPPAAPPSPRASTLPSAESVLQDILRDKPLEVNIAPSAVTGGANAQPVVAGVAPHQPPVVLRREGDSISNRTGRLARDEKTGAMIFVFDSDGKQMADPPMGVIPCRDLAAMEDESDHGNKAIKFRISGEITEYRGKNYIYLKSISEVKDLNSGIGAGGGA